MAHADGRDAKLAAQPAQAELAHGAAAGAPEQERVREVEAARVGAVLHDVGARPARRRREREEDGQERVKTHFNFPSLLVRYSTVLTGTRVRYSTVQYSIIYSTVYTVYTVYST